jgi:peptidoglycan/LPS O-acetylase OafA/YrhL
MQGVLGIAVAVGLLAALSSFAITDTVVRVITITAGALVVGSLCRGQLCHNLRARYPNARWIGLLAVGLAIGTFGIIARFVIPEADDDGLTLMFTLAAAACIAIFVVINRRDPDVVR